MLKRSWGARRVKIVKVPGKNNKHKVFMYAISTCAWCKLTKNFLKTNNIEYEYVDVDLLSGEDRERICMHATRDNNQNHEEKKNPNNCSIYSHQIIVRCFSRRHFRQSQAAYDTRHNNNRNGHMNILRACKMHVTC